MRQSLSWTVAGTTLVASGSPTGSDIEVAMVSVLLRVCALRAHKTHLLDCHRQSKAVATTAGLARTWAI
jgi:hypothetical protein